MDKKSTAGMKPWKRRLLIVVAVVLALLLLAAGAVYFFADHFLGQIGRLDPNETISPDHHETVFQEGDTVETDPVVDQAETIFKGKNVVNILLVGQDKRSGSDPQRTDAMILCTINMSTKTLTMTSFMRDMWVYIPDYYNQRMNLPYMLGGFKLLNETLDYNFGVSADYNIEIDFSGFMTAIDAVGGIEIELTSAEAKYLNENGNWGVEANQHWQLKKGVNLLTGSQALAYTRIRKIDSDFKRTSRQRTVLTTLIEKAKTLGVTEMYNLAKEIIPLLRTDMTKGQMFGLILDVVPMLSDMEIVSQRIPKNGQYTNAVKNGAQVIVVEGDQLEANKKLLINAMKEED